MATTKKSAPAVSKDTVQPAKASATAKPRAVAVTVPPVAKAAAKKVPSAKGGAAKSPPKVVGVPEARATQKKASTPRKAPIDPAQRANYIEVAAFYIAERRGFSPGNPEQDYLDAAAEIDRLIDAGHFSK